MPRRTDEVFPDTRLTKSKIREMTMHGYMTLTPSTVVEVSLALGNCFLKRRQNCNEASQNGLTLRGLGQKARRACFSKYRQRTEKDAFVPPPAL